MYSLETLRTLNAQEEKTYFRLHPLKRITCADDCRQAPDYSGSGPEHIAKRFRLKIHETFFVDSSGFGSDGEPALTYPRFRGTVERILQENPRRRYYAALTGVGQFQVYITLFYKEAKTR